MRDLAPNVFRQRMVIEGLVVEPLTPFDIETYLVGLSEILKMEVLYGPVPHNCEEFGWCGFMHWKTSGCHLYVWDFNEPHPFFSVDIYTCKEFSPDDAVEYTRQFFGEDLVDIDWKET